MRARHITLGVAVTTLSLVVSSVGLAATADPPPTPAVRVHPPGRTFTVAAVGDFLSEDNIIRMSSYAARPGVRYDFEPFLRPIEAIVQRADLAICHMETPIGRPGAKAGYIAKSAYGTSLLAAAREAAGDLQRVGFDRCSTASNHSNDLGLAGIDSTLEALDAAGLGHSGTARNPAEAAVTTFMVAGVRVAHLAYARNSNTGFPSDSWRLNRAVTATQMVRDVARARALGAEVVIVSLHVYMEMQRGPIGEDRAIVAAVTAGSGGADLVIVHGPHVVQPVDRVHGKLVFWSVGNFLSGMGIPGRGKYADLRTLDGLLATVRFTQRSDGTWATEPWTVLLCTTPGTRTVYPGIATLYDPATPAWLRGEMYACLMRSRAVVRGLK